MNYFSEFTRIAQKQVYLHRDITDNNLRLAYSDYKRLMIVDVNDFVQNENQPDQYNIWTIPKTFFFDTVVKFSYWNNEHAVYPYIEYKTVEFMSDDDPYISKRNRFISGAYKNASLLIKLERVDTSYYIVYYINNRILDNIIVGKRELYQNLFVELVSQQAKSNIITEVCLELPNILTPCQFTSPIVSNESILKPDVSLYDYQINDIYWMRAIEDDVITKHNVIEHSHNISTRIIEDKFTLLNNNAYPSWLVNENNLTRSTRITYFGANLVSEVGLGKTLISLYHILDTLDDSYNQFVEFKPTDTCNYFYKRGTQKGHVCTRSAKLGSLYCTTHIKSPFVERRALQYKNLEEFNLGDSLHNDKLKTNATLIVCPNQLCDQWVQEYYSKFNVEKRVLLVVTADQFDNLTLGDILFADIVVTSYQFVTNTRYQRQHIINNNKTITTDNYDQPIDLLKSKQTTFNIFHWHRVMLDEAHEIQNYNKSHLLIDTLCNISSTFKWNITGTPFANGVDSFLHLMEFNTSFNKRKSVQNCTTFDMLASGINANLVSRCKKLFRHNSKQSVEREYAGNGILSTVKLLDFSQQERNIYDSYLEGNRAASRFSEFLIKICCHSELHTDTRELIQNCKTLDEIQEVLLQYNKNKIGSIKSLLVTIDILINAKLVQLEQEHDEDIRASLRQEVGSLRRNQQQHKTSLEATERTFNYLKNAIENINSPDSCPICLDPILQDSLCITRCGHKFCWDCVLHLHNTRGGGSRPFKCPSCNTLINNNEIYRVTNTQSATDELSVIVNRVKSTKIGNIIHYIKTGLQQNDKVILFSQWESLLHKVGDFLTMYKIKVVYCNGSIYQRKNAIADFSNDPDMQVILLSSRNAASGINLTAANKVILLEPIYGTEQFRTNIENQIIGRANRIGQERKIEVIRFIIKDTIEEDIINNNVDDSKIRQLSTS
jgi:SNF2 family DNA or RNA helicase